MSRTSSNLLEEAIVDAEALKEAALKSAKSAILEKYAPDVKKALKTILEQEVLPTDDGEEDPLAGLDSDTLPSMGGEGEGEAGVPGLPMPSAEEGPDPSDAVKKLPLAATESEKLCACPDEDEEIEINFDELERQMAATEPNDNIPDGMGGGDLSQEESEPINLKVNEEIEIDENLLAGLFESEVQEESAELEEEAVDLEENEDCGDEMYEATELEEGGKGSLSAGHKGLDYGDRTDDPYDGPGSIKGRQHAKRTAAKTQRRQGKQVVRQQQSELNENQDFSQNKVLIKENKQLLTAKTELLEENKKLKKVVHDFTKRMEDINLSNAKLVCTNKALTSNSLNERQKIKIVEAISKAESVDEVNVVFKTLQQTVGSVSTKKEPKSLNEAVANKGGLKFPRRDTEPQGNPVFDRMQKMAGIVKKQK